jgi:hypothetical protein
MFRVSALPPSVRRRISGELALQVSIMAESAEGKNKAFRFVFRAELVQ